VVRKEVSEGRGVGVERERRGERGGGGISRGEKA